MKKYKILYIIGTSLSLSVGIWHFFVPALYRWYSYIPHEYRNLIVGIDYTNLCFSLLLSGISLILILWNKRVFAKHKEALTIYGFLITVWLLRASLIIIEPWPIDPIAGAAYLQGIVTIMIFLLLSVPFTVLLFFKKNEIKTNV